MLRRSLPLRRIRRIGHQKLPPNLSLRSSVLMVILGWGRSPMDVN
jgi:hypothetical protein